MNKPQRLDKTTRAKAPDFISSKMPFQASALSGVEGTTGPGLMSDDETREYRNSNPTYTVRSYGTPIAWHGDAGWQQSTTKYSSTTSRHQSIVKRALNEHFQSGHDNAKNPDYGIPLGEK
jgi:hypothetical protein